MKSNQHRLLTFGCLLGAFGVTHLAGETRSPHPIPVTFKIGDTEGSSTTGSAAPNQNGTASTGTFGVLKRGGFLAGNGTLVFPAELRADGASKPVMGIWKSDGGTGLKLLARSGDPAPKAGGAVFDALPVIPGINDSGAVTFLASLSLTAGSAPANAANDTALWSELGGAGLQMLLREDDDIPGLPAGTKVDRFGSGAYATANTGPSTAEAAFCVTMKGLFSDTAILRAKINGATVNAMDVVARQGSNAPGTTQNFGNLNGSYSDSLRMDAAGNLVFVALLTEPAREGIWCQSVAGVAEKLFVAGDAAPGTDGATFKSIKSPAIGSNGVITFRGFLNQDGGNANGQRNDGIWRGNKATGFVPVLWCGTGGIAGMPAGSKVGNVWSSWLNKANHGAWRAWLDVNGNAVSSAADGDVNAIFTDINGGVMEMAVKVGNSAPGIDGASFASMDLPVVGSASDSPSASEWVAFIGKVTGVGITPGTNDLGIWRKTGAGAFQLVIRAGDTIKTSQGVKTIQKVDFPGSGSNDRRWEQPVMEAAGRLLVFVTLTDGSTSQVLVP